MKKLILLCLLLAGLPIYAQNPGQYTSVRSGSSLPTTCDQTKGPVFMRWNDGLYQGTGSPCVWSKVGNGNGSGGGPNFGTAFTAQTAVSIPGTTHALGTKNLIVSCYDNNSPADEIQPSSITVNTTTYDVAVSFASPQTGYCVVNGSGPHRYATTFTSTTSLTVPGATHSLNTADLSVIVYDSATGTRNRITPASVAVNSTTYDVTVTFATAQSGRLVIQ